MRCTYVLFVASFTIGASAGRSQDEPPSGLTTRWTREAELGIAEFGYPRPTLVRADWMSLNGAWAVAVTSADERTPPESYDGEIRVPFPIESRLSGVQRRVTTEHRIWYRRRVDVPEAWRGRRVILHVGACDWETRVLVNGVHVGEHRGGYDAFSFDVTDALVGGDAAEGDEIVLSVWDPTDARAQPRGKQVARPGGIWYTPASGVWQTVWLEPVAANGHASQLHVEPDLDAAAVTISVDPKALGAPNVLAVVIRADGDEVARATSEAGAADLRVAIPAPRPWSPESPFLYDVDLAVHAAGHPDRVTDRATSYFGMRTISVAPDDAGIPRLRLNGAPIFMLGLLDQGFWPDGLSTAPGDEALFSDIEVTKQLGFNLIRKHVKVEPERWYWMCDRAGILVWQDMPSGDRAIGPDDDDLERSPESTRQFELELERMIAGRSHHPSIVTWVPFNEGWGQFDTERIAARVRDLDPTRLVNATSGWADRGVGDVRDVHVYPGPGVAAVEPRRAQVLGEFGGFGLPVSGHTWQDEANWGYRSFKDRESLTDAYVTLMEELRFLIPAGLCAAVYTQTTDVEIEVNGLLTYDRALLKLDSAAVVAANRAAFSAPPRVVTVVPDARNEPVRWRYTFAAPRDGWTAPEFDDSTWNDGPAGFGREGTPGAVVRTAWHGDEIWLRRRFTLERSDPLVDLRLALHHDEDAEVYVNGRPVAVRSGYTVAYARIPIDEDALMGFVRGGENVLAIHCRQTAGGQYVDAGFVRVIEEE